MDLDDCYKNGYIKKAKINGELIQSLIEMSNAKEITIRRAKIDEISVSAYVSMAYDSLREILEAVCISKGYKVTSHVCLGELLKELIEDFDFYEFDRLRYARNGINYYGVKVSLSQGREMINNIFDMKRRIMANHLKQV